MTRSRRVRSDQRQLAARAHERWTGVRGAMPTPRVAEITAAQRASNVRREELRAKVDSTAYRELRRAAERQIGATLDFADLPPDEQALKAGRPVVRLVTLGAAGTVPEGFATGALIAPDLLLTNHHV